MVMHEIKWSESVDRDVDCRWLKYYKGCALCTDGYLLYKDNRFISLYAKLKTYFWLRKKMFCIKLVLHKRNGQIMGFGGSNQANSENDLTFPFLFINMI